MNLWACLLWVLAVGSLLFWLNERQLGREEKDREERERNRRRRG